MSKTLFITGASSGLGRALAEAALHAGHRVVGSVRNAQALAAFEALGEQAHGVLLDVTATEAIAPCVAAIERDIGAIDVLVNNAGYGHEGIFEESPLSAMREQFEVNVFGLAAVTHAVLPFMRQRRRGHIINITSMGGLITMPGISYYCASKFAVEGLSATLAQELAPLGVFVTAVEPGSFRTDWAGRSMQRSPRSLSDYDALFDPIRHTRQARSGHQPGDPAKAALAMLELIGLPQPPTQLALGSDAVQYIGAKLTQMGEQLAAFDALSRSTDG
ncbi:oxidoreductase [Pseudomonas sp. NPDC007930]|uniref:oxidoreductase n=1 Tax=Pseudomonas sp. NPDC007930 TaxID=3364417 RepID=UPI0036E90857